MESRVITGRVGAATSTATATSTAISGALGACFTSSIVGQSMLAEELPAASDASTAGAGAAAAGESASSSSSSLVAVAYPQAADVSNAPAQILGDDSLLLK